MPQNMGHVPQIIGHVPMKAERLWQIPQKVVAHARKVVPQLLCPVCLLCSMTSQLQLSISANVPSLILCYVYYSLHNILILLLVLVMLEDNVLVPVVNRSTGCFVM